MAIAYGDPVLLNLGLLLIRVIFGLTMVAHGSQKLFGWFGGYGLAGTGGFFEQLGYRPGKTFAALAGLAEFGGGLLIALGLLGPVGAALTISVMIVAAVTVHLGKGFFASGGGIELTLLYAAAAVVLALTGPGLFSLDAALGLEWLSAPAVAGGAIALGVIGGVANLAIRKP